MKTPHKKYSLWTAIAMIVGICIGSGIFFKSDNILIATKGSIVLGVLLFVLAAIAIIFGSLTIAQLSSRTDKPGGIITYAEEFISKKAACGFGWFQTLIYYPTISVVVSWVIGIYTCILFNLEQTLEMQIMIGFGFLVFCFIYNVFFIKLGAFVQSSATIIKMIPLLLLGVLGIVFGDPVSGFMNVHPDTILSTSWLAALGPIAYSYDGWVVATSISHEVHDAKRNVPKALMIAPLLILLIYTTYFIGVSSYLGPETVMALGDGHVGVLATRLLGEFFSKAMTVFVIISVMGTVNGLVMGYIRLPYSLAIRKGMLPFEKKVRIVNEKTDIPEYSALVAFVISALWMLIHYFSTKYHWLPNSDVSEIAIAVSYILYIVLYFKVFLMFIKKEITSIFKGVVCPVLATLGSFIILSGGMQNELFIWYLVVCMLVYLLSQWYFSKR